MSLNKFVFRPMNIPVLPLLYGAKAMVRLILFGLLTLGSCGEALASANPPPSPALKSLAEIHVLTNEEASKTLPVAFEASVTYYRKGNVDLFVQDGDVAVYVETSPDLVLNTGDRVSIRGVTRASFRPEVKASQVVVVGHGEPPPAIPASFKQLIRADFDCRRVTIRAKVRSADTIVDAGAKSTYLQLLMDGGPVDAEVFGSVSSTLAELLDAEVEVTGAVAGKFDSKMQMTGILLEVPSLSDFKLIRRADRAPSSLATTPMNEILKSFQIQDQTERVRVQGAVTYYQPGSAVVLQDHDKSLWIKTNYEEPLQIGERVSASGFPAVSNGFLTLSQAEIEPSGILAPIAPEPATVIELGKGVRAYDLVSVQGRLLMAVREAAQDEYLFVSGDHLFSAIYRHPGRGINTVLPPLKKLPVGATVRVTGICSLDRGDLYQGMVPFEILLRTQDDVLQIARPSWLNVRNLVQLVAVLLVIVFGLGTRGWVIERRLRNRTAQMIKIEQMRSDILAQINRGRPLHEVLGQITQLVSLATPAANCWCRVETGEPIGNRIGDSAGSRVVETVIAARSGPPYGSLWTVFASDSKPTSNESAALSAAAELATIAIETSRTHSDLVMRSEFDLLTGLHNRFALEKRLAEIANNPTTVRAIIYLDLDDFKKINDTFGHHVGDLYLREVSLRMKHQIRPSDLLARLGGDEFAVVLSGAHSRKDVQEIARRLDACFDRPFFLEGQELQGSASFGVAYFPDDNATPEGLLKAADAAMYQRKRSRRMSSANPVLNAQAGAGKF